MKDLELELAKRLIRYHKMPNGWKKKAIQRECVLLRCKLINKEK